MTERETLLKIKGDAERAMRNLDGGARFTGYDSLSSILREIAANNMAIADIALRHLSDAETATACAA